MEKDFAKNVERMFNGNTPDRKHMVELTDRDIGNIVGCIGALGGVYKLPAEKQSDFLDACCGEIPDPDVKKAFIVAMFYCVEHMSEIGELLQRLGGLRNES